MIRISIACCDPVVTTILSNFVFLVSGAYDLSLIVEGKSRQDISDFVANQLANLDFIQETATFFVMKKYKEDYKILFENKNDKRLMRVSL